MANKDIVEEVKNLNYINNIALFSYLNNELKAKFQTLNLELELDENYNTEYDNYDPKTENTFLRYKKLRFLQAAKESIMISHGDSLDWGHITIISLANNTFIWVSSNDQDETEVTIKTGDYKSIALNVYSWYIDIEDKVNKKRGTV